MLLFSTGVDMSVENLRLGHIGNATIISQTVITALDHL